MGYVQGKFENSVQKTQIHTVDCKIHTVDYKNRTVDFVNRSVDLKKQCNKFDNLREFYYICKTVGLLL